MERGTSVGPLSGPISSIRGTTLDVRQRRQTPGVVGIFSRTVGTGERVRESRPTPKICVANLSPPAEVRG